MLGLEETIRHLAATLRSAKLGLQDRTIEEHFRTEQRLKLLQEADTLLKAVHLSVELEDPQKKEQFSRDLERDAFIADKSALHQYILLAQQLDKDAKEAYDEYKSEYDVWLKTAGGTFDE